MIGADSLYGRRSGVGRMTLEIALAAQASSSIERVELLVGNGIRNASIVARLGDESIEHELNRQPFVTPKPIRIAIGKIPGVQALRRLKQGTLKQKIRRLSIETGRRLVYHEPNMIVQPVNLPTVSTVNDLSWHHEPSWHPAERLRWIEANIGRTLDRAQRFVVISEFTRQAFIQAFSIPANRIDVVALAPALSFQPISKIDAAGVLSQYQLGDRSYILSISTIEPRKNFDRLLTAYLQIPKRLQDKIPLAIAGGQGWGDVLVLPAAAQAIRTGRVRMLGHVPDADLPVLCARAAVFAYVSLYEGFGLPVVEAMATGTAVLASSTTAVGELATGAAVLVDPLDVDDISLGLENLIRDHELNTTMQASALQRASLYTWDKTIKQLTESWRLALT